MGRFGDRDRSGDPGDPVDDSGRPVRGRHGIGRPLTRRVRAPACALAHAHVALLLVGACAAGTTRSAPSTDDTGLADLPSRFDRRVAAVEARDSTGEPYDFPFLGGYDVPRPQLVDIEGDGDADLFVQEATGAVAWFENTGRGDFVWRTDAFAGIDVGEWYRFADVDGDGDPDLLGESKFSRIALWRNTGEGDPPRFVAWADTLEDASGEPIFAERQNVPNVVDFDCDGKLDLFLGRLDGTVTRYEATRSEFENEPVFEHVTDRFAGIEIVAQLTPSARHGANSLVFFDVDGDGDRDLFWGDFFEPGLLLIENRGTCENPSLRSEPRSFPPGDPVTTSGFNAPTFGDVDGDGATDLLIGVIGGAYKPVETAADNVWRLEREDGAWPIVTKRFVSQIDVGSESVPAIGDLDGDGDLDVLLASKADPVDTRTGRIHLFENVGSPDAPVLQRREPLPITGAYHYAPALGDLDDDGDLDLLLGTWNDGILLARNTGTAETPRFESVEPMVGLTRGSHASPALGDLDGDGDLDLVAGESSGELNVWRNEGTPSEPEFVLVDDTFGGIDAGRRSSPALHDLDGDGDLDLVVGSEEGEAGVYRNPGDGSIAFDPVSVASFHLPDLAAPAFGDLDGDGLPDLLLGERAGGLRWYVGVAP